MSFCPRCVQPVEQDATTCPHCGYSIPPLVAPSNLRTPFSEAVPHPPAVSSRPAAAVSDEPATAAPEQKAAAEDDEPMVTQAAPWEPTTVIASVTPSRAATRQGDAGGRGGESRSRLPWIIAAAAVVVIVAVVLVLALRPSGSSKHPAAAATTASGATSAGPSISGSAGSGSANDGKQQAGTIAGFITRSTAARSGVSDAIGAIGNCSNVAAGVATLQNAATVRTQLIDELSGAHVDAIEGGAAMLANLRAALQASADADRHYAAWGTSALTGCTGQAAHTADFAAAQQSDTMADAAKASFVQAWNAIAVRYGLTPTAVSSI